MTPGIFGINLINGAQDFHPFSEQEALKKQQLDCVPFKSAITFNETCRAIDSLVKRQLCFLAL